ncbi:MAG: hypothetical protein Fur0018_27980 [Anaerolineales bacterium]
MNLKILDYLSPVLRWWLLMVLSTVVAGGIGYGRVRSLPPVYRAGVTLMVGGAIYDPNPSGLELEVPRRLTDMYAAIAQREPVRQSVMERLHLDALPEYTAYGISNSPFLRIETTDTNPKRAQIVANALAEQLVNQSPSGQTQDSETQQFINEQLKKLQNDITETQDAIARNQDSLGAAESSTQILLIQQELDALETKLDSLQTNYANLLSNTSSGALNTLQIVEFASLPSRPIGPNKLLTIAAAALGGLVLSTIGAYTTEYLDDRLKTSADVMRVLHYPIVAHIPHIQHDGHPATFTAHKPRTPAADAIRTLRNNLGFLADPPFQLMLVSSAMPEEGKSTVAVNLATSLGYAGYRVLLMDADLRAPTLNKILDQPNAPGLSDVLTQKTPLHAAIIGLKPYRFDFMPRGSSWENEGELLISSDMRKTLDALQQAYDVIILDGPPFSVPDAVVLAKRVDGLLWVTRLGISRRNIIRIMESQVAQTQIRVLGVVINDSHDIHTRYYHAYGYYHDHADDTPPKKQGFRRLSPIERTKND